MSDYQYELEGSDLNEISESAHSCELMRTLEALGTKDSKNFGGYKRTARSPRRPISILPAPAVPPAGATKICDGKLTVGNQAMDVTAFRLAKK